jgi:hypothetical protein
LTGRGASRKRFFGKRAANVFRATHGACRIAAVQNDQEFFPSEAADHIIRTHRTLETACQFPQDIVAGVVPELIADLLEMIDIAKHDNRAGFFALQAMNFAGEQLFDDAACRGTPSTTRA